MEGARQGYREAFRRLRDLRNKSVSELYWPNHTASTLDITVPRETNDMLVMLALSDTTVPRETTDKG